MAVFNIHKFPLQSVENREGIIYKENVARIGYELHSPVPKDDIVFSTAVYPQGIRLCILET